MKIVINRCYGGFGLSHEAVMLYAKKKGIELYSYIDPSGSIGMKYEEYKPGVYEREPFMLFYTTRPLVFDKEGLINDKDEYGHSLWFDEKDIERIDPLLVEVVEELKGKANGKFAKLEVIEIPDDVKWEISDYDGVERVEEIHRSWS